jgi:hypothetical protein
VEWLALPSSSVQPSLSCIDLTEVLDPLMQPIRQERGTEAALEALQPYAMPEGVVLGGAYWLMTASKA